MVHRAVPVMGGLCNCPFTGGVLKRNIEAVAPCTLSTGHPSSCAIRCGVFVPKVSGVHFKCSRSKIGCPCKGHRDCVRLHPHVFLFDRKSALHWAVLHARTASLVLLVVAGARVTDELRADLRRSATAHAHPEVVE